MLKNKIYKIVSKIKRKISSIRRDSLNKVSNPSENHQKISEILECEDLQHKFSTVYLENLFNSEESRSGEGSNLHQTRIIRQEIPRVAKEYKIRTFIDAPCGDWNWMKAVDLDVEQYIGVDIVPALIEKNNKQYKNNKVSFKVVNLVKGMVPQADLIFSRDCLVHLSFADSIQIIKNFKKSGAKYFLTTTFTSRDSNLDLEGLFWRPLNMQKAPFNFPAPLQLINEGCEEDNGNYADKCLGLWLLEDIKL